MSIGTLPHQDLIEDQQTVDYMYRVLTAQFGDGYSQVAEDGINNEILTITVTYRNLRETAFNEVLTFIRGLKGANRFLMTPKGFTSPMKFEIVPNSIRTTVTGISRINTTIVRSIEFQCRTAV